jgi:hypothetical protein
MTERSSSPAYEGAVDELAKLPPLSAIAEALRNYPARLLERMCEQAERRKGPVPEHTLTFIPYLGETAIRALVDGGYIQRLDDLPYTILAYLPADKGNALAALLRGELKQSR